MQTQPILMRVVLLLALLAAPWLAAVQPAIAGDDLPPLPPVSSEEEDALPEGDGLIMPDELPAMLAALLPQGPLQPQDQLGTGLQEFTPTGGPGDQFGYAVSLSADGSTALVGAKTASMGAKAGRGAAYIFTRTGTEWKREARLLADDGAAGDEFGQAVALSDDGSTALVGAYKATVGSLANAGAAYVYVRSTSGWVQQARLTAIASQADAYLGRSVALSANGDTALLGAYRYDDGGAVDKGVGFIFYRSAAEAWYEHVMLNSGTAGSYQGYSVALNNAGNRAALGAPGYASGGKAQAGRVNFYEHTKDGWIAKNQYAPADLLADDWFGRSVALDDAGQVAVVGASRADINSMAQHGAVYVLTQTPTSWAVSGKLIGDGDAEDYLGVGVAVSGDGATVLAGAYQADPGGLAQRGAAYCYTLTGGIWGSMKKLNLSSAAGDQFGISLALSADGSTQLIGANLVNYPGSANQGAAFVALRAGGETHTQARLTGAGDNEGFGTALAASDDGGILIAGALNASVAGKIGSGAAYVFQKISLDGRPAYLQARLAAPAAEAEAFFGRSVALDGTGAVAVVGAPGATVEGVFQAGAAYVFTRSGSNWTFRAKLTSPKPVKGGHYGDAVALSDDGTRFLIGAPGVTVLEKLQGGAYLHIYTGSAWLEPQFLTGSATYCGPAPCRAGVAVALSGDGQTALIGAHTAVVGGRESGAAFVFVDNGHTFTWQADLLPPATANADNSAFGRSLSLSDDGSRAAIGAPYFDGNLQREGSVFLFTRSGSQWTRAHQLTSGQPTEYAVFGSSVALSGTGHVLLVGAPTGSQAILGLIFKGSNCNVYPFTWKDAAPAALEPVGNVTGQEGAGLGAAVALDDNGAQSWFSAPNITVGGMANLGIVYLKEVAFPPAGQRIYLPVIQK